MADCVRCGRPLPSFTAGELSELCPACQQREQGTAAPAAAPEPRFRAAHSVTAVLIAICVLVYLVMVFKGVSAFQPNAAEVLKWGADWGPLALGPQPWRMLTSAFVHIGIIHLALNMWCLWELGSLAEVLVGKPGFLALYLFSAVGGEVASLAWHPQIVSAGASGAIFGVAGALIALFSLGKLPIPHRAINPMLKSLVVFAGYNLVFGFLNKGIDNAAHVGGLITGLVLGALLSRRLSPEGTLFRRVAFTAMAVLLVAGAWTVRGRNGYIVHAEAGRTALSRRNYDAAIREFQAVIAARPRLAEAHFSLGSAYLGKGQFREAGSSFLRAIGINPRYSAAYDQLGVVYIFTGHFKEAHTVLTKALTYDPRNLDAQGHLGQALEGLGRDDEALAAYQKAVARAPQFAYAYFRMGFLHLKHERWDAALASLQAATRLEPQNAEYLALLAVAYNAKGMKQEAAAALQKAMELKAKADKPK